MMVLTFKSDNREIDLKINERQKIEDVIDIISKQHIFAISENYSIRSIRDNRNIDRKKTFDENNIYNGDIILIINQ